MHEEERNETRVVRRNGRWALAEVMEVETSVPPTAAQDLGERQELPESHQTDPNGNAGNQFG